MSRTYKVTGINLKSMPLGESDRLITILTQELGLIRAVAPGARKQHSSLSGRSGMFVVNELLLAKGRSLDKITQAETIRTYPRLSQDLGKLAASQYLAEMVIAQALSEQPQEELFCLLNEHLKGLEQLPSKPEFQVLVHLSYAIFHLLTLAGIMPQVEVCCLSKQPLMPDFTTPDWQVGFSVPAGGIVSLSALKQLQAKERSLGFNRVSSGKVVNPKSSIASEVTNTLYQTVVHQQNIPVLNTRLNATELALLQQLTQTTIDLPTQNFSFASSWISIEQIFRQYIQYHFGRPIRSATLIDSYFAVLPTY